MYSVSSSDKIKRCPCCGNQYPSEIRDNNTVYVNCSHCGFKTKEYYYTDKQKAIDEWNNSISPWHTGTPTEEGWYLVTYGKDYIYEAVKFKNGKFIATDILRFELMNGKDAYEQEFIDMSDKVVAWMPIEPYKEEEDGR